MSARFASGWGRAPGPRRSGVRNSTRWRGRSGLGVGRFAGPSPARRGLWGGRDEVENEAYLFLKGVHRRLDPGTGLPVASAPWPG